MSSIVLQDILDAIAGTTTVHGGDLNHTVYLQQIRDAILGVSGLKPGSLHEIIYLQQIRNAILGVPDGQFGSLPASIYLQQIVNAYNGVTAGANGNLDEGIYYDEILDVAVPPTPALVGKAPDEVAGLTSWGDADQTLYTDAGTTLAVNNDDLVYRIHDLSGNARHMNQTLAGSRGKLKLAIQNGRRGILCDGANGQYVGPAISNLFTNSAMTMFFVCKPTSIAADTGTIYNNDPFWCDAGGFIGLFSKGPAATRLYNFDGTVDETASLVIAVNNAYVLTCWHTGGSIFAQINANASVSVASGNTTNLAGLMDFFRRGAGAGVMGSYYFAHASYNVSVSAANRSDLIARFMQRWGIT